MTDDRALQVLHVNTFDRAGGAEQVARDLHSTYTTMNVRSRLMVGMKRGRDPSVSILNNDRYRLRWQRGTRRLTTALLNRAGGTPGIGIGATILRFLGEPLRARRIQLGWEDFDFPATRHLIDDSGMLPDIVHYHNLHGGYFDLRELPFLSQSTPAVMTLHDAWLLSGHCAHSFECNRWETGCGWCPDLQTYPAIRRDATAFNWTRKQQIFQSSRIYLATPSCWLMDRVKRSMLQSAIVEARVIPNGADLDVFNSEDRRSARRSLGIPDDTRVLLFAANGIRTNIWKDFQTLRVAVARVADQAPHMDILFLALGESAPPERVGRAEIRFVPPESNRGKVAEIFKAADLYLHAARADVAPLVVLEALCCGTPVIATAIGGIPEQVKSLAAPGLAPIPQLVGSSFGRGEATGILVQPGNPEMFAGAVTALLCDDELRHQMGQNAAADARSRFGLHQQAGAYLAWYREILERRTDESDGVRRVTL